MSARDSTDDEVGYLRDHADRRQITVVGETGNKASPVAFAHTLWRLATTWDISPWSDE